MLAPVIHDARRDRRKATTSADLVQAAEAPERELAAEERGEVLRVLRAEAVPAAAGEHDGTGAHRVHPDAGRSQFGSGRGGEVDLGGLGDRVGGPRGRAHAGDGRDDHAGGRGRVRQVGQAGADQLGGVPRVQRKGGGEVAGGGVGEVSADRAADVRHQVVKAAQCVGDLVDGGGERGRVGDVRGDGRHGHAVRGQAVGGRGQAIGVAGDDPHGRPLSGQRFGHREADAPAPAGDQSASTPQAKIHAQRLSGPGRRGGLSR